MTQTEKDAAKLAAEQKLISESFVANNDKTTEDNAVKAANLKVVTINDLDVKHLKIDSAEIVKGAFGDFYAITCNDVVTNKPINGIVSVKQFENWKFASFLTVGSFSNLVIKVYGLDVTTENTFGYFSKRLNKAVPYSIGFHLRNLVNNSDSSETKRAIEKFDAGSFLVSKFEAIAGCKPDYTNPEHLALIKALA